MAKESAEEKLLKMMQKTAPSVAGTAASAAKPAASSKKKFKFTFSVGLLNTLLFLGIVICIILLVIEMQSGVSLLHRSVEFSADSKTAGALVDNTLPANPNADYYLQKINSRNIFKPFVVKTAEKKVEQGMVQLLAKFKLVGISWLDLPESASIMIEDTQKKETLFLKQGEQLEGVTVKTIYTDRVVFSHENEETTIKL